MLGHSLQVPVAHLSHSISLLPTQPWQRVPPLEAPSFAPLSGNPTSEELFFLVISFVLLNLLTCWETKNCYRSK